MKIQMTGGSPWGFKMTGGHDFRQPLAIGKVTAGSKADRAGVIEGHHILTVNGEDVTQLAHLAAQNKIKAAKTTLILELSNAPPKPKSSTEAATPAYTTPTYTAPPTYSAPTQHTAPHTQSYTPANTSYPANNKSYAANKPPAVYNSSISASHSKSVSLPSKMSTSRSPTTYTSPHTKTSSYDEPKNATPDVEYRPVDSRDSQRRMYEELQDSDFAPTVHQSTLQSPSMKALARSSEGYAPSNAPDADKKLLITEEIRDMILEEETDGRTNGHHHSSVQDASLRQTGVRAYDPHQKFNNRQPSNPAPAPYAAPSSSDFVQPPSHSPQPNYGSQPQPAKSKAIGNISKFLQSSGAKQGQPTFVKTLQDLQCPYGDPAVLEIRIGNTIPVPTVSWYHNEKPIRESREKDIKFLSRGIVHTLVLGEFAPEFAGRYRCVLTNKHGSASCNSILALEQLPSEQGYLPPPPPQAYSNNSAGRAYQPSYTSSYQAPVNSYQPQPQDSRPSISVGLYSQNTANEAYAAQTRQKVSRDDGEEESAVMRALREEGHVKPQHKSRSMRMLEENLMPESEDL